MKVSQKQAVRNAIFAVLKDNGINYELNGSVALSDVLTSDHKKSIRDILFTAFRNQEVEFRADFQSKVNDDAELKKYVSGLLNNWVRKDKEFNVGQTYEIKNPGSRSGSQDDQVKEMRKLLKITTDASAKEAIQKAIDERVATLKPDKQVSINIDALPEHLRHFVK